MDKRSVLGGQVRLDFPKGALAKVRHGARVKVRMLNQPQQLGPRPLDGLLEYAGRNAAVQSFSRSEFPKQRLLNRRNVKVSGCDPKGSYGRVVLALSRNRMVQEDPIGLQDAVWESRKTMTSLSAQPL